MFNHTQTNGLWLCHYSTTRLQVSASGKTFTEAHTKLMQAVADKLCDRKTIDA